MMRHATTVLSVCLLSTSLAFAAPHDEGRDGHGGKPLDCSRRSLADAVDEARANDPVITFTGVCSGPIVIHTEGLTLKGVGTAVIDGDGHDAVTVAGAGRVTLSDFEVRNGLSGILAVNGAHVTMTDVNVHGNRVFGVSLQTTSSAVMTDVTIQQNGLHGLDVQGGSAVTVTGALTVSANQVFGININGSSLTLMQAHVTSTRNVLGLQIATGSNAFLGDPTTVIDANNNLATGLTVVSGAHLVSFGGTINAGGNGSVGVSVNSKAGLDLDAGSTLNSVGNGDGVLIQQNSVMTVFNNPQFSGAPGYSTINASTNVRSGVRVLTDAVLTLSNQARVNSTQNGTVGFQADNGAGVTLVNSTITGNATRDILMTFGARADFNTLTFGTASCDATVLVRGSSGITCPR